MTPNEEVPIAGTPLMLRPTTEWTFQLDSRTAHSSVVRVTETQPPIFATPATLAQEIARFPRSAATPDEVTSLLELAEKLLSTSPIHYEFAAVAWEKSLHAVELALRLRLNVGKSVTFAEAIKRYGKMTGDNYVTDWLDTARELRNVAAHPQTAPAMPIIMMVDAIRRTFELIAVIFAEDG